MGTCFSSEYDEQQSFQTKPGENQRSPNKDALKIPPKQGVLDSPNIKSPSSIVVITKDVKDLRQNPQYSNLDVFTYDEMRMATKLFRPDQVLGEGGFGVVYKGLIDETVRAGYAKTQVAVKELDPEGIQGDREWLAEVHYLGQLQHPNLVKLIGYCCEEDHRLLVYEYMASLLNTRTVVRLRGPDTIKFLQGLLTNDVRRFGEPVVGDEKSSLPTPNVPASSAPSLYAAMLTPQGRFFCDMFLYEPPRTDEKLDPTGSTGGPHRDDLTLFADVDCDVLDDLFATFNKFSVRSKVHYEHVGEEFSCWQRFGVDHHKKTPSSVEDPEGANVGWGGGIDRTGSSSSQGNSVGWQWHKDPRLDCLGFRGIFPSNSTPPMVEANTKTDEGNYLLWRLERGVAEGSIEIPRGEAIPLEYNLVGLNAISFDKGCYVGQELVARSHHRGVIRKRLFPLKFLNESGAEVEQKVAPSSEVIALKSSKKAGTVTTAMGSRGLGLLRLEEAFKGSGSLVIKGQEDVKVEAIRPEWWPSEWYLEHEPQQAAG